MEPSPIKPSRPSVGSAAWLRHILQEQFPTDRAHARSARLVASALVQQLGVTGESAPNTSASYDALRQKLASTNAAPRRTDQRHVTMIATAVLSIVTLAVIAWP